MGLGRFVGAMLGFVRKDPLIEDYARDSRLTVFGGQALRARLGPLARPTDDWDFSATMARARARQLERRLDRNAGTRRAFFVRKGVHPGTWKVIHSGPDLRKNTPDDRAVADFTPTRKMKSSVIRGVRYAELSEIARDKRKAIRDPNSKFREGKDREDLMRIELARTLGIVR